MKHLLALTLLSVLAMNANAVTPSKKSTTQITETQVKDEALAGELAKEVEAEESSTAPQAKPAAKAAPQSTTQSDELTLEDNNDQAIADEMAAAETQQIVTQIETAKRKKENNMYISGSVGVGGYPQVNNIIGRYAGTFALGYIYDNSFMFEGGLTVAQYKMDALNPTILNRRDNYEIDQYGVHIAAKYRLAFGKIVPNAGAMLAVNQRRFTQRDPNNSGNNSITVDRGTTQTTDAGLIGGIDFELNKDFAIGLDFKYMMNLSNNAQEVNNVNATSQSGTTVTPIERLESYTAGVSARMNF